MRALVTTTDGSGRTVRETTAPTPRPRPDQALVRVSAVSVNRGDLAMLGALPEGSRLGFDVAGTVVSAAADGSGPPEGTSVAGVAEGDGWAEEVAVPTARLAPVPDGLSWATAAATPVAGLTALYALRHAGSVLARTVVLTGASGGVGRFAVQLASLAGARVVALAGTRERTKGLRELGADVVGTYGDEAAGEPADSAEDSAEPADVLMDSVGGDVLTAAFARVVPGGTVVCYGNTTRRELTLPPDWGRARPGIQLRYLHLFDEMPRRDVVADLGALLRLTSEGRLTPEVAASHPWTEAPEALLRLERRQVNGKAVLLL